MLKTAVRIIGISCSVLFLLASAGIIFWISQSEQERLVLKERAGLSGSQDTRDEEEAARAKAEAAASLEGADKTIHDIDTLLSTFSTDDLPNEE